MFAALQSLADEALEDLLLQTIISLQEILCPLESTETGVKMENGEVKMDVCRIKSCLHDVMQYLHL